MKLQNNASKQLGKGPDPYKNSLFPNENAGSPFHLPRGYGGDGVALLRVVAAFARIHARPVDGATIIRAFLVSVALCLHLRDL